MSRRKATTGSRKGGRSLRAAIRIAVVSAAIVLPILTQGGCGCNCDDEMKNYRALNGEPDSVISKLESAIFIYKERGAQVYFIWGDMASQCCDVIYVPMATARISRQAADSLRARAAEHQQFLEELL